MNKSRILITGASGCVGQYITSWLINNSEADLFLWLREPKKLTAINANHPRIKILVGDLRDSEKFTNVISKTTHLIHTATAWGDPQRAYEVNVAAVKKLLKLLNPNLIEQIIYFSTASILNKNLEPLPEAFIYGTEYIQTKAKCLDELEHHALSNKIIAVFPTLVFGGRVDGKSIFPKSYLTEGLIEAKRWLWLARWLKVGARFHFIHAADIALICGQLATTNQKLEINRSPTRIRKIVLAQESISINQAIDVLRDWSGLRKTPQIPLWNWLIQAIIKVLPIQLSSWDLFSIKQYHFIHHPITNPESLGKTSYARNLKEIIENSGLDRGRKHQKELK